MTAILTAAEMRALERAAIDSGEVTGLELMERAGRGVVEAILAEWPGIEEGARRAVVLCGPGNNGGDGFVVARLLRERGWAVEVFLYGDPEKLPPDASANFNRWIESGNCVPLPADPSNAERAVWDGRGSALWIDALFGTGLARPVAAPLVETFARLNQHLSFSAAYNPPKVVAVDGPSGLCSDSGRHLLEPTEEEQTAALRLELDPNPYLGSLWADLTVTFQAMKPGHLLGEGPLFCRSVKVVDLGLRPDWKPSQIEVSPRASKSRLAKRTGHKYGYGHALVLSGGCGKGGAARMAARGALRIGAGLVTLAVPPAALQENAGRLDAIMLRSVNDPEALADTLSDARLNALCVGPGFGTGERQAEMLAALLDASRGSGERKARPVVLDADALTLVAKDDAFRARLHAACVLTPHEGEFARLFPEIDARWRAPAITGPAFSKVDAAREAAAQARCVVLLKGPDTVIAEPSGRAAINAAVYDRAAPWLATAGSGDVLAGFITGLLARGFTPYEAACTAAWLHVECARSFGPGLIAEDLPEELPKVFRALGL